MISSPSRVLISSSMRVVIWLPSTVGMRPLVLLNTTLSVACSGAPDSRLATAVLKFRGISTAK